MGTGSPSLWAERGISQQDPASKLNTPGTLDCVNIGRFGHFFFLLKNSPPITTANNGQ